MRRAVMLAAILAAGCARSASHSSMSVPPGATPEVREGLSRLRAATNRFHALDSAVAAGYPRTSAQCYVEPGQGAMGYHHVNRSLVDRTVDVEHPEILLYERGADSSYTLTAVEYIVPYRVWPADSTPPTVMGMPLGHVDVLNLWGLHMWVWKANPAGMFEWWNPDITCRENQTRMPAHS